MSTTSAPTVKAASALRTAIGIGGVIAVIVGLLILIWPGKTAAVVAAIVALYAIAGGLVYAGIGIFSKTTGGWARAGHVLAGIVFIAAGVIALLNLADTTIWLGVFLGLIVGIMWIVEGIAAFTSLSETGSSGWTIFYATISIVAGIFLLFSPLWGATVLWLFLGVSLLVLGVLQVIRAFTFGRD